MSLSWFLTVTLMVGSGVIKVETDWSEYPVGTTCEEVGEAFVREARQSDLVSGATYLCE